MSDSFNREYVLQEAAAMAAELRVLYNVLDHISLRLECLENWSGEAFNTTSNPWCSCDCGCEPIKVGLNDMDDASYRMD